MIVSGRYGGTSGIVIVSGTVVIPYITVLSGNIKEKLMTETSSSYVRYGGDVR